MNSLLTFLVVLLTHSLEAQVSDPTSTTTIANTGFTLFWYHWVCIIVGSTLITTLLILTTIGIIYYYIKIYRVQLVQQSGPVPPGYVLKKDLPVHMRDEVDFAEMEDFFKKTDGFLKIVGEHREIPRTDISIINRLGIGEFGPIYDAEVKMGINDVQRAMIKVFHQGTSQDLVLFREEVEKLLSLDHPQVGRLLGIVSKSPYYILAELSINGDLKTFLVNSADMEDSEGNVALPVPKLVAMASDVASGLSYLECMDYVHRDIATRNCLVTENLCIKVTDFKVGRYLYRSEYAVQTDGSLMPLRWMAPESISDNTFTLMSSAWSFGVLLWEIMSRGAFPYSKLSDEEVANGVCHYNERLPQPGKECPDRVYKVMLECWSNDCFIRPPMSLAHKLLESSILTNKYDKSHVRLYS